MSGSQRGGGRGGYPPSGPIAQRGGRGRGGGSPSRGSRGDGSPPRGRGEGSPHRARGGRFSPRRGGRGRGGQQGKKEITPAVYGNENFPQPSTVVQNVEEKYLKDYDEKRGELDDDRGIAMLPYRPNYSSRGEQIILWANYFHLRFPETAKIYKYDVVICDPKKRSPANDKDDGKADDGRVTGRKVNEIFEVVLNQVRSDNLGVAFATDFKQKIVTTVRLKSLPTTIVYPPAPGNNSHQYDLTSSEQLLEVGKLFSFLKNQAQTPEFTSSSNSDSNANGFPFYQDIIDAIGIILGHAPRESEDIVNVGRSRFFSTANEDLLSEIGDPKMLKILKGFSQSVRPTAGRLLLNVNVTHSIFRPGGTISDLFNMLPVVKPTDKPDRFQRLNRIVSKGRVRYTVPVAPAKKGDPPRPPRPKVVTIAGLGRDTDRCGKQEDNPRFPHNKSYGNAREVQFRLKKSPKLPVDAEPATGLQWNKFYTVYEYFNRKYQYRPEPEFPVVNIGTPMDPTYVPAECCELLDFQPIRSELEVEESEDMTEFAVKTPEENAKSISGIGRTGVLKLTTEIEVLKEFGVTIEPELITVKGRHLSSPRLLYSANFGKNDRVLRSTYMASWNLKPEPSAGLSFHTRNKPIYRWAWIFFSPSEDKRSSFQNCVQTFRNYVAELGVEIANEAMPPDGILIPYQEMDSVGDVYRSIMTAVEGRNLEFALVILPKVQADIYTAVKLVGDISLGFHTVCVTANNFSRSPPDLGLYANLATKINLKFGGVNHAIDRPYEPFERNKTMIVGYDVVHPTGQAGNAGDPQSQVGLVASIGQEFGQWRSRYWTQAANQEIVGSRLVDEFKDQLTFYKANQGTLPVHILMYRDGVSEGQYLKVLREELPHIFAACGKVYEQAQLERPSITLVVSVKRHATRFFPTLLTKIEKSNNIQNGTIVDRGVTQARCWDFYLKSHTALRGTAHPTHYVVLHDEIFRSRHLKDLPEPVSAGTSLVAGKRAAEDLEEVTHQLCYIYGRATKAISICTPARYADIVCTRARLHALGLFKLASGPGLTQKQKIDILGRTVHKNLENTMYWI